MGPMGKVESTGVRLPKLVFGGALSGLALSSAAMFALRGSGAELQWDGDGAGAIDGGNGTWNTTLARWWDGAAYKVWNNSSGDSAVFAGNAGTVSAQGVTVRGLRFDSNSYS